MPGRLEQRHLDLIGLFLIASGVYLIFVLFFGWDGGKVGYGVETGLTYLFGKVGARIFTVLILVVGVVLVTGTSISAVLRGLGRGTRRVFLGGTATAQTVLKSRRVKREAKTSAFETQAGPTDVMSTYPEGDEFEPTVALVEDDFDHELYDTEQGGSDPHMAGSAGPGHDLAAPGQDVGPVDHPNSPSLTPMGSKPVG